MYNKYKTQVYINNIRAYHVALLFSLVARRDPVTQQSTLALDPGSEKSTRRGAVHTRTWHHGSQQIPHIMRVRRKGGGWRPHGRPIDYIKRVCLSFGDISQIIRVAVLILGWGARLGSGATAAAAVQ